MTVLQILPRAFPYQLLLELGFFDCSFSLNVDVKMSFFLSSYSRPPFSFITQEVVEATCQCLLAQAEEAERLCKSSVETEGLVLEEFGRCLLQIIEYASKAKGSVF